MKPEKVSKGVYKFGRFTVRQVGNSWCAKDENNVTIVGRAESLKVAVDILRRKNP